MLTFLCFQTGIMPRLPPHTSPPSHFYKVPEFKDGNDSGDYDGESRLARSHVASQVIQFHKEAGLEGSDAEIAGDILGYRGECDYAEPTEEEVTIALREIEPFMPDRGEVDRPGGDGGGDRRRRNTWTTSERLLIKLVFHVIHDGKKKI